MRVTRTVAGSLILLVLLVPACSDDDDQSTIGLPNPASVYCEEQGGTIEMRQGAEGVSGVCVFEDGSECEEWAFFRGECTPGG